MLLFDVAFKTFAANAIFFVLMTNNYNICLQNPTAILKQEGMAYYRHI